MSFRRWTLGGFMATLLVAALVQPACTRPTTGEVDPQSTTAASATAATENYRGATPSAIASASPEASEEPPASEASPSPAADSKKEDGMATDTYRGLRPFPGAKAPEITQVETVRFQTDAGDLVIEVYPQAAPNAAKRFLELVEAGFYDNTPIFRVVKSPRPFVAQFGVNWRAGHKDWQNKRFNDDPSLFEIGPGTLAFAKAGPNTNSTQVFVNYGDNSFLKDNGGFSTFARIVEGFDNSQNFKSVGDPSMGLDQGQLWNNGEKYLEGLPAAQKPTMIKKAEIVRK